ncbi:MAG: HAD-IIIA family hydrolase [Bacteroidota bacterium]
MMGKRKAVFLDRDGVINQDNVNYTFRISEFIILDRVIESLFMLKDAGYLLIIVTNQSGIAKGIYTREDVWRCFHHIQEQTGHLIDEHYFAPHHPDFNTESLTRKPDSLMIEKGIAKFKVDTSQSWMVGDSKRDMIAAQKQDLSCIMLPQQSS